MTGCDRDSHPMSPEQQAIWVDDLLHPVRSRYQEAWTWQVEGPLDVPALAAALNDVVQRHPALRGTLLMPEALPVMVIEPDARLHTEVLDAATGPSITDLLARPLPLDQAPLVRATVLRSSDLLHQVVVSWHHAVVDGWSMGLLARDVSLAYRHRLAGEPPDWPEPAGCAGCWATERAEQLPQLIGRATDFWRGQLSNAGPVSRFEGNPVADTDPVPGHVLRFAFDQEQSLAIEQAGRSLRCGMFVLMVTALAAAIWSLTGSETSLIGCPVSRRGAPGSTEIVGCLTDLALLALRLDPQASVRQNLRTVRDLVWETMEHSAVSPQTLRESLGRAQVPVPDIVIGFDDVGTEVELPGVRVRRLPWGVPAEPTDLGEPVGVASGQVIEDGTAKYGIFCEVVQDCPLRGVWHYRADQYDARQSRQQLAAFRHWLVAIAERPDETLAAAAGISATGG
ncbi:MAG: condensation domain-containing protein [Actinomycetota bacterium]|nr:condensation domain-containing protein [Actinomycetota bacterium]